MEDCLAYFQRHAETPEQANGLKAVKAGKYRVCPTPGSSFKEIVLDYVAFDKSLATLAQAFWQNSGENISSRFAAHCLRISSDEDTNRDLIRSDERFSKVHRAPDASKHILEYEVDLEKCLGASKAIERETFYKGEIKSRVAAGLAAGETDCIPAPSDVYLFPSGMSSIYNTLRLALSSFAPARSVCFG